MQIPVPQRLTAWMAVLLMTFSFTSACVVDADDDDGVEQVDTDEDDSDVEVEVDEDDVEETP